MEPARDSKFGFSNKEIFNFSKPLNGSSLTLYSEFRRNHPSSCLSCVVLIEHKKFDPRFWINYVPTLLCFFLSFLLDGVQFLVKGGPEHWKLLYYSPLWANAKYLSKLNPIVQKPSLNFATWNLFKKTYLLFHQCKVGRNTYRNTNLRWDSIDFFENLSKTPNLETHVRIRYKETN